MPESKATDWTGDLSDTEAIMARWSEVVGHTLTSLTITRMENGNHSVRCEWLSAGWRLPEFLTPSWQFIDPPEPEEGDTDA